jgi:hypothetical protein
LEEQISEKNLIEGKRIFNFQNIISNQIQKVGENESRILTILQLNGNEVITEINLYNENIKEKWSNKILGNENQIKEEIR